MAGAVAVAEPIDVPRRGEELGPNHIQVGVAAAVMVAAICERHLEGREVFHRTHNEWPPRWSRGRPHSATLDWFHYYGCSSPAYVAAQETLLAQAPPNADFNSLFRLAVQASRNWFDIDGIVLRFVGKHVELALEPNATLASLRRLTDPQNRPVLLARHARCQAQYLSGRLKADPAAYSRAATMLVDEATRLGIRVTGIVMLRRQLAGVGKEQAMHVL